MAYGGKTLWHSFSCKMTNIVQAQHIMTNIVHQHYLYRIMVEYLCCVLTVSSCLTFAKYSNPDDFLIKNIKLNETYCKYALKINGLLVLPCQKRLKNKL